MDSEKQSEDKKNEQIFKNMAMTFSVEGITRDIQDILQKKMNYHIRVLKELNGAIESLASFKDTNLKRTIIKESKLIDFAEKVYNDYELISGITNTLLTDLLKKKSFIDVNL